MRQPTSTLSKICFHKKKIKKHLQCRFGINLSCVHVEPWCSCRVSLPNVSVSKRKASLLAYCWVEKNKLFCVCLASQKVRSCSHLAFNYPAVVFSLSMSYRLRQHMWWNVQTQMLSIFLRKNRVLQHNWSKVDFIIVTSSLFVPPSIPISWTGPLAGPF